MITSNYVSIKRHEIYHASTKSQYFLKDLLNCDFFFRVKIKKYLIINCKYFIT